LIISGRVPANVIISSFLLIFFKGIKTKEKSGPYNGFNKGTKEGKQIFRVKIFSNK
jgi:hypothetical protein